MKRELIKSTLAVAACASLFVLMGCGSKSAEEQEAPRIVNFINFVRDIEPRIESYTPEVLFETTRLEAEAIHQYGFHGTWLLQYDALIDTRYQDMMREEMAHGCEVGGWWEITQPHVEAAGYEWRGRYPWDWHADKGFAVGYTQEERERLVDVYMEKFKEIFGCYPNSIGSWFIDAHTLAYMREKYKIEGCCMCRDQVGTDGYTLWGGYWHGAYYPSRVNAYMPAQTKAGQIDLPVFRMLGSDPLYQYSAGVGGSVQSVCTMEPTYVNAQQPEWVAWYLRCQTEDPALGYTYFQAGQENSFTWPVFQRGYEVQLPQIAQLQKDGKLRVETLIETARNFMKQYPTTPATACTAMSDYTDRDGKTVWFNSRFYRTNILWQGDRMTVRDIHLFDERVVSPYYDKVCTSNQCIYMTQPLVDGCLWSTASDMAGLGFYCREADGTLSELHGETPLITTRDKRVQISWPLKEKKGEIRMCLDEKEMKITCSGKFDWCMLLHTQPEAKLPFTQIEERRIAGEQEGYAYQASLKKGRFVDQREKGDGSVFLITPDKKEIVLRCDVR